MGNIASFFDIDGTTYREGLITAIFKKMITSEIIEEKVWLNEVREKFIKWDRRIGGYDDYLLKMAEIYIDAIKGLHSSQIEFIASKVIEQNGDRVYTYTRDQIKYHRKEGHKLIIISGSPSELISKMAHKHGFDDCIGSLYSTDINNLYTGEVTPMWDSISKQKALNNFVKKYNIDLSSSYAYGDTTGDFSMLKSVAYPVAVNPTKELLSMLKQDKDLIHKAKVIVERKNMTYSLNLSDINI